MKQSYNTQAWLIWLLSASALTLITRNPLYLLIILLSALIVRNICGSNVNGLTFSFWRFAAIIILFSVLFNVLLVHIGQTVLITLPRNLPLVGGPLTLEAAVFGLISALILITLLAVFLAFNQLVPASDLVALAPRALANVGIVVLIAVSYVPETLRQLERVRQAQALRGHRVSGLRDWRPIFIPLLIGGLERSMNLAETMVSRGYGSTVGQVLRMRSRLLLFLGLLFLFSGWTISFWQTLPGWALIVLGGCLLLIAFVDQGRHVVRTKYFQTTWRLQDWLVIGSSLLPLLLVAFPFPALEYRTLGFSPYPELVIPGFDPILGVGFALLAVPALFVEW